MGFFRFLFSKAFGINVLFALALTAGLVFFLLNFLSFSTNHGAEVVVPDLHLNSIDEGEKKLDKLDLEFVLIDTIDYDETKPKFAILSQEPEAGKKVKPNRKVYVKINAGDYQTIILPDLMNKSFRQAQNTFAVFGLQLGDTIYKTNLSKDMVLGVQIGGKNVAPGSKLKKQTKIDLILGDGKVSYYDDNEKSKDSLPAMNQINVPIE
jgi:beta-lactam-binding protein with PASTA domain